MVKTKREVPHLGAPGYNSPGYGPRFGTPEFDEAAKWTKEYWDKLWKASEEHKKKQQAADEQ